MSGKIAVHVENVKPQSMFIRKLHVENWKNFRHGEVRLARRLFLIGPNASGKSNFLDVFRFLRDLSLPKGGGFRQAVETREGVSAIRCLAARQHSDIVVEIEIQENSGSDGVWKYRLSFNQDNNSRPILKEELVEFNGQLKLKRPDNNDNADPMRLTQTALEQITANQSFRQIVSFLQNINYQHLLPPGDTRSIGFFPGTGRQ